MQKFRSIYLNIGWILIIIIILSICLFNIFDNYTHHEASENELWGLKVGDKISDVKFKRGKPSICVYDNERDIDYCSYIENYKPISFLKFRGSRLQEIGVIEGHDEKFRGMWGKNFEYFQKEFDGFSSYSSNKSGEKRIYCNPKRHIAVGFEKGIITYASVFLNECPKFVQNLSVSSEDSIVSEQIPEIAVDPKKLFGQFIHRTPNQDDLSSGDNTPDLPSSHDKNLEIVPIERPEDSTVDPNDY